MTTSRSRVALSSGLLELNTNAIPIPDFQLGPQETPTTDCKECECTIKYTVGELNSLGATEKGLVVKDGSIAYTKSLGVIGTLKCEIRLSATVAELKVNKRYHRLGRASIDTVPSVGKLLEDIVQLQLLMNNYTLLYGGSFSHGPDVYLLIGLVNTGKTTTTLRLVREEEAKYISEDIAITDGETLYCCPYALSPIDSALVKTDRNRFYEWISGQIPLLDRAYSGPVGSIFDILRSDQVVNSGDVTDVFILSPGDERAENPGPVEMLALANRAEFTYPTNQILLGAQYLGYDIDIEHARETEHEILQSLVRNAEVSQCYGKPERLFTAVKESVTR